MARTAALLVVVLVSLGWVQLPAARITGRVVTGEPPRPLAGALVRAGDATQMSGADGTFELTLSAGSSSGRVRIRVTAAGYLEEAVDVTPGQPVEIALLPNPRVMEGIDVVADETASRLAPPVLIVEPRQVLAVPGALDNVFRVLQTLPGVNAADDFGSRLSVRGGGPDQNLTVMDGVEIHNPYRLFGLTSAFNPETIDRFTLTAGGFDAPYGDRLSSILVVENRDGTNAERFAASSALSVTDANVVLEGRLPGRAPASWLVSGRRTYYDLFAERVTKNDLPSFADVQAKVTLAPRPGQRLSFFGLRSRERTDAEFGRGSRDFIALDDAASNDVAAIVYGRSVGDRLTTKTAAAWYHYLDALGVDGSVRSDFTRSNTADEDVAVQQSAIVFTRSVGVRDLSVRQEVTATAGARHTLGAGIEAHRLSTSWNWRIRGDRNLAEANGSSVLGGAGLPSLLDSTAPSSRAAAWIDDAFDLSSRVHLRAGVRLDWSSLARDTPVSPRLRATFDLSPVTRLKIAGGRYTQAPGYEKLLQSDYFVDLTGGTRLSYENSWHVVSGLERDLRAGVSARLEAYYKRFGDLVVGRLETPAETAARVAQYAYPPALAASVPAAPQITTVPGNDADGDAYGFDVFLQRTARTPEDRVTGWASYTWGRALVEAYGRRYPFDYDRRHAVSAVANWRVSRRFEAGATLRAASGFPETRAVGLRVAPALAAPGLDGAPQSLVPKRDANGLLVWTTDNGSVDNLNGARLPLYVRLDVRLTYAPSRASRWQFYGEVINATNRENAGTLAPVLVYNPGSDRPNLTFTRDAGLPLLPSFGLRLRF